MDVFITRGTVIMTFGLNFADLHSFPKERQLQKSCDSFGEECMVVETTIMHSIRFVSMEETIFKAPPAVVTSNACTNGKISFIIQMCHTSHYKLKV